ncbi:MAG TPA: proline--tRNA ligase, partial [Acidimicrobiia bacterium]
VREEMDAAGSQEVILPIPQPLELWQRSGRDKAYGPTMFRLHDRKDTGFALAPTAEEVITSTVAAEYSSYRDLPLNVYQINWKYRDEVRPRFGLLRGREFLMKDAYSFHTDEASLLVTYQRMYDAYSRVFERCALVFRPVEGEAGEIGGDVNHEFMAVAEVGEDDFVWCPSCDYAANVEVAKRQVAPGVVERRMATLHDAPEIEAVEKVRTPGMPGITAVASHLGVEESATLKCIAFDVNGELGLALVPGDREVNEYALARAVAPRTARLYNDDDFTAHPDLPKGYIGPNHPAVALVVADPAIGAAQRWVTGANEVDHHVRNAVLGRDFDVHEWADLVVIRSGDACANCGAELSVDRGIEVGQVFQIGTKYSKTLGASYTDEHGESHPMVMGTYGIGVSRVVAAVVEQHHDDLGITWPVALAPYHVHVVALFGKGAAAEAVRAAAEKLYTELADAGVEVLYDDRDASPGVKFADADLVGVPVQLTVGAKGLARGVVERKDRATGTRDDLPLDDVVAACLAVATGA